MEEVEIRLPSKPHPFLYENQRHFRLGTEFLKETLIARELYCKCAELLYVDDARKAEIYFQKDCVAFELHRRAFDATLGQIKNIFSFESLDRVPDVPDFDNKCLDVEFLYTPELPPFDGSSSEAEFDASLFMHPLHSAGLSYDSDSDLLKDNCVAKKYRLHGNTTYTPINQPMEIKIDAENKIVLTPHNYAFETPSIDELFNRYLLRSVISDEEYVDLINKVQERRIIFPDVLVVGKTSSSPLEKLFQKIAEKDQRDVLNQVAKEVSVTRLIPSLSPLENIFRGLTGEHYMCVMRKSAWPIKFASTATNKSIENNDENILVKDIMPFCLSLPDLNTDNDSSDISDRDVQDLSDITSADLEDYSDITSSDIIDEDVQSFPYFKSSASEENLLPGVEVDFMNLPLPEVPEQEN